jgi:16S rRNA G527 N7-methylase RsmG
MKSALKLSESNKKKTKYLIELTAKCALENNNIDFAWKSAMYAGRLSK